jgi:benzoyl-CoA reductase/2-hydroxyglutaryl-CoA dehydratase subunit BcrC/BadD/HgdB
MRKTKTLMESLENNGLLEDSPPIFRSPKTRSEINRKYYAKRIDSLPKRFCTLCDAKLRADCDRDICAKCWRKTDEGKEYMRLAKEKSRLIN